MQMICLPEVKKSFDAMVEAEATFKADLEKLLKNEGHMPEENSVGRYSMMVVHPTS